MGIIQALLTGLATIAGPLVIRALLALGMSFVAYKGIDTLVQWCYAQLQGYLNGLPGEIVAMLGVMNVDRFFEIVFTAYTVRMTMKGLQAGGLLTKISWGHSA